MKKTLVILIIVMVGLLAIFFYSAEPNSLQDSANQYGKSLNSNRLEKHLPIIEESWIVHVRDSTHIRWSHKSRYNRRDVPEHIWKTLYFEDSVLVAEEDAFNFDQGDSVGDRLIILSSMLPPNEIRCKFSRHYYKRYPPSKSIEIDFNFADSVLKSWGFKNLYSFEK